MATICFHHISASMRGATARGSDDTTLLAAAGINPTILVGRSQRVHTDLVARLFRQVQTELDDEFMGFTRNRCKVGLFPLMCQWVSSSQSLGDMLNKGAHFYGLVTEDVRLSLERAPESPDLAIFSIQLTEPALDPDNFLAEFLLVIWHRLASWIIGEPIRLEGTHFTFAPPDHQNELAIMFPGALHFGAPVNRLVFDARYLQKPLTRSARELDRFLRHAPSDIMTIPGYDTTLEAQIERHILAGNPDKLQFPSLDELARSLSISPQSLHRQLKKQGSSYQKIKDNLRQNLAVRKLVSENLSVDEVSDIVGFAEPRSFTRAFRQWTGLSPRAYKKAHANRR
ncbi:MAG: AraC family transcriptional regulator ligand-binding domain-containing protein [bacterium]